MDTTATTVPTAQMVLPVGTLPPWEIPEIPVAVEEAEEAAAEEEEEATYRTRTTTASFGHLVIAGYKSSDISTALPNCTSAHQIAWTIFCVVRPITQPRDFVDFGISLKRHLIRVLTSFFSSFLTMIPLLLRHGGNPPVFAVLPCSITLHSNIGLTIDC
ncbi:hypothetical protein GALMADRAFT_272426 [Galerina marginata CBS 339.88]|uniref:Uncharacterized protein n=1 Tax=Galerina marginata (strain CBS 339.88) TaxID=685588 RepID=A0A067SM86_GALM3|nr:hypothetical protein GALMADRAFT_272426 [Galerina marginata CBS 339.88]